MKKLVIMAVGAIVALSACNKQPKSDQEVAEAMQTASNAELQAAISDRDSLLSLVNDISLDMDQIKRLEGILAVSSTAAEGTSPRDQAKADLQAIQQTLEQRRQRLAELEARLSKSNLANSSLRKTIETLRSQIDAQSAEIETLRNSLADAHAQIGTLNTKVDSLNTTVANVSGQRDAAEQKTVELANEMNTCYYVFASSKELKEHKILETGFLRKDKLMKGNFDQSFFRVADKRTLTTINLHAKKAKVLTNQPAGSYDIVDNNGQKTLRILNPEAFWSLSNYLVIEVD